MEERLFAELPKKQIPTMVVDAIRAAISEGKLKTGDKLPSERTLAQQLGISRVPLREGLRMLSAYGVVEIRPGEGVFVADNFVAHVFEYLGVSGTDSVENIQDLLVFRRMIETTTVEMSVNRITKEDLAELRHYIQLMAECQDVELRSGYDAAFHRGIVACCGNPYICAVYGMIHEMLLRLIQDVLARTGFREETRAEHLAILDALEKRDAVAARKATEYHLACIEAATCSRDHPDINSFQELAI